MSIAVAHFAFGAALTALVVTYLPPSVPYPRSLVLLGGAWAMVPDAHWLAPVHRERLFALHGSPWMDVFWLHRTLDVHDATDSKAFAALAVGLFIAVTVLAERRNYRTSKRIREAMGKP